MRTKNTQYLQQTTANAAPPFSPSFPASPYYLAQAKAQASTIPSNPILLPLVLLILDGWGVASPSRGNAISLARTPNFSRLMQDYPTVTLHASGEVVGLPWAEMGNSEVGHLNIGAGKIIYQHLPLINKSIADGTFFRNETFLQVIQQVKEKKSNLHLIGLVSEGGVHSSIDHLFALLELCRDQGLKNHVFVQAILDGRDTEKNSALSDIARLETKMAETGVGVIASMSGRFYAMDRDNHWERTEEAYKAIRYGQAENLSDSPLKAIEVSYARHIYDEEFVPVVIIKEDGTPRGVVQNGDGIIFFNFRADRMRQLTKSFVLPAFSKFPVNPVLRDISTVCMTEYEKNLPTTIVFQVDRVRHPLARIISETGMRQLHIAETEKYAHVTFFFNGGHEDSYPNEDRVLIPSPRVSSYDQVPEMSVKKIVERLEQELMRGYYHFYVVNFANADMVGHSGNLAATIKAVEAADEAMGRVAETVEKINATLIITADHGNAEEMINLQTGEIIKEHTTNPVPLILINSFLKQQRPLWPNIIAGDLSRLQPIGVLSDVAPTVLTLMGLKVGEEMTSRSVMNY